MLTLRRTDPFRQCLASVYRREQMTICKGRKLLKYWLLWCAYANTATLYALAMWATTCSCKQASKVNLLQEPHLTCTLGQYNSMHTTIVNQLHYGIDTTSFTTVISDLFMHSKTLVVVLSQCNCCKRTQTLSLAAHAACAVEWMPTQMCACHRCATRLDSRRRSWTLPRYQ